MTMQHVRCGSEKLSPIVQAEGTAVALQDIGQYGKERKIPFLCGI